MADMKDLESALKALQMAKALHNMKPLDGQEFCKLGDLDALRVVLPGAVPIAVRFKQQQPKQFGLWNRAASLWRRQCADGISSGEVAVIIATGPDVDGVEDERGFGGRPGA